MAQGPRLLNLEATLRCPHIAAVTAAAIGACGSSLSMPALLGWRLGEDGTLETEAMPAATQHPISLVFVSEAEYGLILPADEPGCFTLALNWHGEAGAETALDARRAVLGALAAAGVLLKGVVRRHLGGQCLPVLPLAEDATHVLACPPDAVAQAYESADPFAAAWDRVDQVDGISIFARALDATGNPDFLRRVLPGHMAMARLARDGVEYATPQFADGEFDLLNAGEPTLTGIGYHATDAIYEFAGHTPPGTELRCIDLLNAWRLAAEGQLEDGRPVREVRAVFMDREEARRAYKLLHAGDVAVLWEDQSGTLHPL